MSASLSKYRHAFDVSQKFLDILQIDIFPINPFSIFLKKKGEPIFVFTLKEYNLRHNYPLSIKDAKCFYYPGKAYLIVYNSEMPKKRIRFSLIHELAHIVLNHLNDERTELCRGGVEDRLYRIMEGAANTFTGNFLAPPILISEKLSGSDFNIPIISFFFGLSEKSVYDYRYEDYNQWLNTRPAPYEINILNRCREHLFPKYCMTCGHFFYSKHAVYCPICGKKTSLREWGKNKMIYNDGNETNEFNQVVKCQRCDNEEIGSDDDFCRICGAPVFNKCEDYDELDNEGDWHTEKGCDTILESNARYCSHCGHKSSFFRNGLLSSWDKAKVEIETRAQATASKVNNANDEDLIEIDDDDLPFNQ